MISFWWLKLPRWVGRRWPLGGAILGDGRYLARWPLVGSVGPLVAIAAGVVLGGFPRAVDPLFFGGYNDFPMPYTASLILMGALLALGTLSAALAFWLVLGYAVSHLFALGAPPWTSGAYNHVVMFFRASGSLLIASALLFGLVVLIPIVARGLQLAVTARMSLHKAKSAVALRTALTAALTAALVYAWVLAAPVLIRPWYLWSARYIAREAIQPLQGHGAVLVLIGVVAVVLRTFLRRLSALRPSPIELAASQAPPVSTRAGTQRHALPVPVGILIRATLGSFLLAGLAVTWSEWIVLWSVFALAEVARAFAAASSSWSRLVSRIPILLRLVTIVGASLLFGWLTVRPMWSDSATLAPLIYALAPTLVVAGLLLPRRPRSQQ